jgi:hypothetical protein
LAVLEVIACVAYVATYKGPLRNAQLTLCASHAIHDYHQRQNLPSNWPAAPALRELPNEHKIGATKKRKT